MVGLGRSTTGESFGGLAAPGIGQPSFGLGRAGEAPLGTAYGKIAGFTQSALESFPEMFGLEVSPETQAFRAANPVSGFVSQLLGTGVGYGAAAKALSFSPKAMSLVNAAPAFFGLAERPIASAATRWATEAAMIEAGRLSLAASPLPSMVFGKERDDSFGELLGESALNVAGGAVLGGIGGAIKGALGKGPRISDLVPGAHPSFPLVQRVNALEEAADLGGIGDIKFSPEQLQTLNWQKEQLKRASLAGIEPTYLPDGSARLGREEGARYTWEIGKPFSTLEGDVTPKSGRNYTDGWNALMRPGAKPGQLGVTRLLTTGSDLVPLGEESAAKYGFPTRQSLDEFMGRLGLGENARDKLPLLGQDFRAIVVNEGTGKNVGAGAQTAARIENTLTGRKPGTIKGGNPVSRVGDDWFMVREEDGLWGMAKKVKGEIGKPSAGDEWFVFRTHQPDVIDPKLAAFRELTINRSAYWPNRGVAQNIGESVYDAANLFEREFAPILSLPKGVRATASSLRAMGRDVSDLAATYLAPAVGVVARNKKANYALNLIKGLTDFEEGKVSAIMDGTRSAVANPGQSLARQVLTLNEPTGGGLRDLFKTLEKEDWADVQDVLEMALPFEKMQEAAAQGHFRPKAVQVLTELEKLSRGNVEAFSRLKEHVGASNAKALLEDFNARAGHYGLSRQRDGGYYALVDDARTGELAGVVSGSTAKEARDAGVKLIADQAKRYGRELQLGGIGSDLFGDIGQIQKYRAAVRRPGFVKQRGELLGYDLMKKGLNAEDFSALVERNLKARERLKTNVVLQEKLWPVMQQLRNEDQLAATAIEKRLQILQGDEGDFARFQNAAVDKVLGGVLGKDSASEIVRTAQKTLNAFQFGFGNLAHYVLNAVTMFQTMFPEAAFLLRTAGKDTSNYITVPLTDSGGRIVDSVSAISDVKLFRNALKMAFTNEKNLPDDFKQLVQEMISQKLIAPKYAEEHFGSTGTIVKDVRGAFEDGRSFLRWLGAVNEIGLAKSEEFNRLIGVTTSYQLAKMLGISDPYRMARFTREFLSKTAFNYSTVDRPTIFTTPVGSLLGTFKTWSFHYMANMAKYAGGSLQDRQLLAPLLWQTAATGALGGGAALPLVLPMANAASKWLTDKSFMENLYSGTMGEDQTLQDTLMYGLPGALGLSLAAQASSPGADPARDAGMLFSFAVFDRMRALGRATGDAITAYKVGGASPFEDDRVRDGLVRALAPRTLYRALSASEDNAIRSLNTGYRVMDEISLGDALLYSAGFNPVDLDKTYTAYSEIRKSQQKRKDATSELGKQLAEAWDEGDNMGATRVFTRAMAMGLDTSSVLKSAKARQERSESTSLEFTVGQDKTGEAAQDWGFVLDNGG